MPNWLKCKLLLWQYGYTVALYTGDLVTVKFCFYFEDIGTILQIFCCFHIERGLPESGDRCPRWS